MNAQGPQEIIMGNLAKFLQIIFNLEQEGSGVNCQVKSPREEGPALRTPSGDCCG